MAVKIILVRPRNPLNIGAAARAMGNFGLRQLCVVNPYEPVWREAVTAVHSEDILAKAQVFDTIEEAVKDCHLIIATTALKNRTPFQKIVTLPDINGFLADYADEDIAILFGPEKTGLTAAEISCAHAILNIPTTAEVPSINLAQAVILCCYELGKNKIKQKKQDSPAAPKAQDFALVQTQLQELMDKLDFPPTLNGALRLEKMQEISAKMALSRQNLFFVNTIIKQINKKLKGGGIDKRTAKKGINK